MGEYEAEIKAPPSTVCVTGASGYIASEIISRLLRFGHTVHGTVRGDPTEARFAPLKQIPGAEERLKLFKAELTTPNSFDHAISGCKYVIHVASPVSVKVPPSQVKEKLVGPAVQGVENVISAVNKTTTVNAVIMTSSVSAIYADNWERGRDHTYTESDWTLSASESFFSYSLSKTLAEKKAWELYEAQPTKKWRLVTILPAFVLGKASFPGNSELVKFAADLMNGKLYPFIANFHFGMVHLDDVAAAHILAMLDSNVEGRIIVSQGGSSRGLFDVLKKLHKERFLKYKFPVSVAPTWLLYLISKLTGLFPWDLVKGAQNKPIKIDGSRAERVLGLKYKDPVEGLASMCEAVVDLGLAARKH